MLMNMQSPLIKPGKHSATTATASELVSRQTSHVQSCLVKRSSVSSEVQQPVNAFQVKEVSSQLAVSR